MPADADRISLAVAGHEHRDWESYSIDSDFFTPADAWQVSLGIPAGDIPAHIRPWAEAEVRLGADVVLTGRIDALRRRLSKGAHTLTLLGRDRAAVLLDCSAPVLARRELTLAEVCATWLRPLGIDRIETQGGDRRKKVTVEPGMSAWEALERAAELAGLWPWFAPDGVLHVAAPDYGRSTDAELILRADAGTKNNVLELSFEEDVRRRYSEVTVLGQGTGDEHSGAQPALRAVARDARAGFYRPLIRDAARLETAAQAQARANKLLSDSIFESWLVTARVRGHRTDSGAVWEPGMRIRLVSPPLGLDVDAMLARRTLTCDRRNGAVTTLYLRPWGLWLPDNAAAAAPCEAVNAGALPDLDDAPVTLLAAPSGVQSAARLTLAGGTDAEDDAALLARLLDYMRNPPSGGTAADYRRWAREVPGVADAQVYPLRQGPGTVDVVITGPDGIPDGDVVAACQAHIDAKRPVTAWANVYAPLPLSVDMTLKVRVVIPATLESLRPDVRAALESVFVSLRPGEALVLSHCIAAVSRLASVADVVIAAPAANVQPSALQWCRPGVMTLEAL